MANKKAAIELSIGTIVIIVLAMSMLILGIVLIKNIFFGATSSVELIDRNVKAELNRLFNDESTKSVVYLPDNQAEIDKGKGYNVRFGIKNVVRGEAEAGSFTYSVTVGEVETGCRLSEAEADSYIRLGKSGGPIKILPGEDPKERIIVVEVTENAPLCSVTYDITVKKDGQDYDTNFFIVRIKG
jgi:hypothetical protein